MGYLKIATAGILGLPALVLSVVVAPIIGLLSLPSLALLCFQTSEAPSSHKEDNTSTTNKEHAIISGGSSGIGLSIAQDCVQKGMEKVTILARSKTKLETACKLLETKKTNSSTVISYRSVDVSNPEELKSTADNLLSSGTSNNDNIATKSTTKYYLFCCAGQSYPSYFEHVLSSTYANLVNVNQLGTIYTVQAFLPHMDKGTIVLTSSMAGQVGVYGYTAYSPTKFALRGFAESLHAELADRPYLNVQLAFPPDTDTPGFQEEEKIKPKETRLISEQAGLAKADDIANAMVKAALASNPEFLVYFDLDGWMLAGLTAGMSPVSTLTDAVTQVALGGLFRFISLFYLNDFWRIIRNCAQDRIDNNNEIKERPSNTSSSEAGKSSNNKTEKSD